MKITQSQLKEQGNITLNNEHEPWQEWQELGLGNPGHSWAEFDLFLNGQCIGTYRSFGALMRRANPIIEQFNLKVSE